MANHTTGAQRRNARHDKILETAKALAALKIKRVYTRHYGDNDQRKAYVEWADGGRTEGEAVYYHGVLIPAGAHMGALFDRAIADGLVVEREIW